jgi:hypothetical protein
LAPPIAGDSPIFSYDVNDYEGARETELAIAAGSFLAPFLPSFPKPSTEISDGVTGWGSEYHAENIHHSGKVLKYGDHDDTEQGGHGRFLYGAIRRHAPHDDAGQKIYGKGEPAGQDEGHDDPILIDEASNRSSRSPIQKDITHNDQQ